MAFVRRELAGWVTVSVFVVFAALGAWAFFRPDAPSPTLANPVGVAGWADYRIPLGQQWIWMDLRVENTGSAPLTLHAIRPSGTGIGSTITIRKITIATAPDPSAGTFVSDPPAEGSPEGTCRIQRLVPVAGYDLSPGSEVVVAMLIEAHRPGRFWIGSFMVSYSAGGDPFSQRLTRFQHSGTVVATGGHPINTTIDPECVGQVAALPQGA